VFGPHLRNNSPLSLTDEGLVIKSVLGIHERKVIKRILNPRGLTERHYAQNSAEKLREAARGVLQEDYGLTQNEALFKLIELERQERES
jgi:hypothetical protein